MPQRVEAYAVGEFRGDIEPRIADPFRALYLKFLYTPEAQEIIAQDFYRARDKDVAARHEKDFAKIDLFTIDDVFGGWTKAQATHFADGGTFDQIFQPQN